MAYNKIGFHTSPGGYEQGLGDWMRALDAAGIPFCIKGADYAGPVWEGQQLAKESGVQHVLVYRRSGQGWDVPNYDLSPFDAAAIHWQQHRDAFPPELDKDWVWLETINEVDKGRADWLGWFAFETAQLVLRDGYRWAAFGWSSGEPEPEHWETPGMLAYLDLAAVYPGRLAVALHEYSFTTADIMHGYPYKIGRFQFLFDACDQNFIPRPTVLITEWGWEYNHVPEPTRAMGDIAAVAAIYADHPQILGANLWHLGGGYDGIALEAQKLIEPMTFFTLNTIFDDNPEPPDPPEPPLDPGLPRIQYEREYWVVSSEVPVGTRRQIYLLAAEAQKTCGPSYDDSGIGALEDKTAVLWELLESERETYRAWYEEHYPTTIVQFRNL